MKKLLIFLTSLLALVLNSPAQTYTTVTATLVDSSSQVWANATVIASLRPAPGNPALPLNNGLAITDSPQTALTDGSGSFTLILDDNKAITPAGSLWTFNIFPNASVTNSSSISLQITGTTLSLSGVLSSILTVPSTTALPVINRAYSDSEVVGGPGSVYWNTTANALKGCNFNSNICTWVTIGNLSVPGSHYYIPYNNGSGGFTASSNLQFNDSTNTFSTVNGSFTTLLSNYFSTSAANPATAGVYRLASGDTICWRNNANTINLCMSKNASNQFTFPGVILNPTFITPDIGVATGTSLNLGGTGTLSTTAQSGTGSICMTTSCAMTTPTLGTPILTTPVINGASTGTGVQGTDSKLATAATISTTPATAVCSTANGGVTTTGCPVVQASFNAPQRVTMSGDVTVNTSVVNLLSETVTVPSTAGTYRLLASYSIWTVNGANVCTTQVLDSTNSFAWASFQENDNGLGWSTMTATELSSRTYNAGDTPTIKMQMICQTNGITAKQFNPASTAVFASNLPSYMSITPVLSNN